MAEHFSKSDEFHTVNGVKHVPTLVPQETVDKMKNMKLYPDDVWVVTYPKCGTTWTQQLVRLIRNRGVQDDVKVFQAVPWLEAGVLCKDLNADELPRPRAFKTHFTYDTMPCGLPHETPCKYIYVTRNPKDVAASGFCHVKVVYFPDIEWEGYWKQFTNGDFMYGDYFEHLKSWLPHKDDKNVLFLTFEDMKKNLSQAVSKMAAFMDVDLTSEEVAKIAEITSFEKMKDDNTANLSWLKMFENEKGENMFMRRGEVGDWKNFLSKEQSAQIDEMYEKRIGEGNFKFDYE